jgi:hypothetical protein
MIPYNPAIPFLGPYLTVTYTHPKTCAQMLIAASFKIVKRWNNPDVHHVWKNTMRYILYSGILIGLKRNEVAECTGSIH